MTDERFTPWDFKFTMLGVLAASVVAYLGFDQNFQENPLRAVATVPALVLLFGGAGVAADCFSAWRRGKRVW